MKTVIDPSQHDATLARWHGSNARIWIFDVSLTRLVLRLARPGEPEVLYLVGAGCEHIVGPFSWKDANISIVAQREADGPDLVIDKKAGFELQCRGFAMAVGPPELNKTLDSFLGAGPSSGS